MKNICKHQIVLFFTAVIILLSSSLVSAVNNQPPSFSQEEKLQALQKSLTEKKLQKRADKSAELAKDLTDLEKEWGIKLFGIRWTAAGYMLEMKFRVLDPEKAFPLLKRDIKRYVVVDKSGAVLEVPFTQKLGSLKSSVRTANMVKKDYNYIALFANPGKHVNVGDKVTLVIGNFMAENLIVQ